MVAEPARELGQVMKVVVSPLRPNGELWFRWALCVFFVLAKPTRDFPLWGRVGVPALVSLLWMSIIEVLPGDIVRALGRGLIGIPSCFGFFIAAAVFSALLLEFLGSLPLVVVAILSLITTALDVHGFGIRFGLALLAVPAGFGLAQLLACIRPLRMLGMHTLPVYVAHIVFIVAMTIGTYHPGIVETAAVAPDLGFVIVWASAIILSLVLCFSLVRTHIGRYVYQQTAWFQAQSRVRGAE